MRLPTSRLGWLATTPYLAALLASAGFLFFRVAVAPAASELAAVPLVVLALPWSILGISIGESVGLWVGFLGGLVLNAVLCYRIGVAAERRRRRERRGRIPTTDYGLRTADLDPRNAIMRRKSIPGS